MERDLLWAIKSLLSTKDRMETGIFKNFKWFARIWKIRARYKANKIGERAEPCPTPMLTLKKGEEKFF